MIFEEIQQRLDQDLEEYKDDEEREREEKKHHLYQLKQQLEQYLLQVLTITKAGRKIIADVDKLQLLCLDIHEIVVPFHGILTRCFSLTRIATSICLKTASAFPDSH
jgi:hypothetical protein